jgi:hypothetical protein
VAAPLTRASPQRPRYAEAVPADEKAAVPPTPIDPLVLEAVREVDASLLDWALSLTPRERLRASTKAAAALGRYRHDPPSPS